MELLNLDELSPVERQVQLKGEVYTLAERQVGQMIQSLNMVKKQKELEDSDDDLAKSEAVVNGLVDSAKQLLPDCPEKVLRQCSIPQITALLEFANASDAEIIESAEEEIDGEKKETMKA